MARVECLELVFLTVTCIIGNTKARVLPLPVGAEQHISRGGSPSLLIIDPDMTESSTAGIT